MKYFNNILLQNALYIDHVAPRRIIHLVHKTHIKQDITNEGALQVNTKKQIVSIIKTILLARVWV